MDGGARAGGESVAALTAAFAATLHALGSELKCGVCLSLYRSPKALP